MHWKTVLWMVIEMHSVKRELPKSSILYTYIEDELKKWNQKSGQTILTSIWRCEKTLLLSLLMQLNTSVCLDPPTADFPRELIATQIAQTCGRDQMCYLFPDSWKMQNYCLWTRFWDPPPPLPPLKMYAIIINTLLIIMNKFHWLATNVYIPIIIDVCILRLQYVYSIIFM